MYLLALTLGEYLAIYIVALLIMLYLLHYVIQSAVSIAIRENTAALNKADKELYNLVRIQNRILMEELLRAGVSRERLVELNDLSKSPFPKEVQIIQEDKPE